MEGLAFKGEKIASCVLAWRELSKLRSTYTDALIEQIDSNTGRVHTSYAQASTITGRLFLRTPARKAGMK